MSIINTHYTLILSSCVHLVSPIHSPTSPTVPEEMGQQPAEPTKPATVPQQPNQQVPNQGMPDCYGYQSFKMGEVNYGES